MSEKKLTEEELTSVTGASKFELSAQKLANRGQMGEKARGVIEDPWNPTDPVYGELSSNELKASVGGKATSLYRDQDTNQRRLREEEQQQPQSAQQLGNVGSLSPQVKP